MSQKKVKPPALTQSSIHKRWVISALVLLIIFGFGAGRQYVVSRTSAHKQREVARQTLSQPMTEQQLSDVKARLLALVTTQTPAASFEQLRSEMKLNKNLERECHPILHHIGHAAFEKYKNFEEAVRFQDGLCNSGYTHGVIEAHFFASKDLQATLLSTCPNHEQSFKQWQCFHGAGHGVMYATNKNVQESIDLCSKLPSGFSKAACINGIYMERFIVVSHFGKLHDQHIHIDTNFCKNQSYKADCYLYAPTAFLTKHPNDYKGAFEDCNIHAEDHTSTCIGGVGSQLMKENISNPKAVMAVCRSAPDHHDACMSGALGLLLNHYGKSQPVEKLCTTEFVEYRKLCQRKVNDWQQRFE